MSEHNLFFKSFTAFLFIVISMQIDANQRTSSQISEKSADFVIIAHRGASGYLPEHTIDAATLAFMQGA
jgi:glycerophosphoryl diester phosphodiesterase